MHDLTPVGLSKDGNKLLLISASGEEYAVAVDRKLRAALKGDQTRIGQLEMKMESALRPRDIQNRIRGGESAEAVATAAGTTVDAIMGFAGPVLAERAHVAQTAQKASVRRRSSESPVAGRTLEEAGVRLPPRARGPSRRRRVGRLAARRRPLDPGRVVRRQGQAPQAPSSAMTTVAGS